MKQRKDSSTSLEQAALGKTILQKLSTIEDLLKRKDDKPLTFKDACAYLGYAPSYLYKLTYKSIVPHYKPTGKIIFFSKNELDEWIFRSSDKCRVISDELKTEDGSAALTTRDPNQIEMDLSEEVLIEFPLKSRRKK
ncbi:MAG: helix-turn-helix domain-containing protein [Ignavibacteriaceae bacterium]|nr:helix-turn-helix domain-containing protein [Ignavibacteriaceae bacterium]